LEKRLDLRQEDLFGQVMDVALAPPGGETQGMLWQRMLKKLFDPLQVEIDPEPATEVEISRGGLALKLPEVSRIPAFCLEYAHGGSRLFSPREAALASELVEMLRHAIDSRSAYEAGMAEERSRIAREMHDNIGAQLLAALHSHDGTRKNAMVREALADLRDLINSSSSNGLSLDETLAELRVETADRLASAGIQLQWQSDAGETPGLHPGTAHAIRSIVREAVSNVIQHAAAHHVDLTVNRQPEFVSLVISDDGRGFNPATTSYGHGLANMRTRLDGLQGTLEIQTRLPGTRLSAYFPTHEESP
jgi:signal transduction histidine kinase